MHKPPSVPKARELLDEFKVTVRCPGSDPVPARLLDIGFRSMGISMRGTGMPNGGRGVLHVDLKATCLGVPIEAVCRVQDLASDDSATVARLDVLDWIGLKEQLPLHLRRLLSFREMERYEPPEAERPLARCLVNGMDATLAVRDLSINGASIILPESWAERLEKGHRVSLSMSLPGVTSSLELVGIVRHVTEESGIIVAGLAFDVNVSSDLLPAQLRLMRYIDSRATPG